MGSITLRVRSLVWCVTGALLALLTAWVLMSAWQVNAAPGDTDSTFVGISPCRLADTRPAPNRVGSASTLGPDSRTTFEARGTNGECTIPSDAVGLSLNVTALGATATGNYLTIWPDGDLPLAASLNPAPGEPPTPNAVIAPLSTTGSFNVYNFAGTVNIVIDVNGYYTRTSLVELDSRLAALEAAIAPSPPNGADQAILDRLAALENTTSAQQDEIDVLKSQVSALETAKAALEAKTASMSLIDNGATVRFSGVNVQVVDGSGDTDGPTNGRGNLIIGYNEDTDENGDEDRTGSHNLVTGTNNDYTSYGGIVFGRHNTISGTYATVSGGNFNTASGAGSSVTGGNGNTASGAGSSVTGGNGNTASGDWSSVTGGNGNTASGDWSSATGGTGNIASGDISTVSGGLSRVSPGAFDWVAGSLFQDS